MSSILVISHYYPPEVGAPQARLSEMATVWTNSGIKVSVVTCMPNHPNGVIPQRYHGLKYLVEHINEISIYRCQTYATPNKGVLKKLLSHLVFMVNVVRQFRTVTKSVDIILVSSPTFFPVISAYCLSKMYHKPFIFEVRDLWPAVFKDLNVIKNEFVLSILEKIELFLYKKSVSVVTVTQSFTKNIISRRISRKKLHTITNGVNLDFFKPIDKDRGLTKSLSLDGKFVVLYLGAHGISHGLKNIVSVAKRLEKVEKIHFLFVGDGAKKDELILLAKNNKLGNISFVPSQPKSVIPNYYSIADTVLVPLKDISLFDQFIPSKMFEIMAMGKPIIGSVRGEAAEILRKSKGALICEPEDINNIKSHILTLHNNLKLKVALGKNGLSFVQKYYNRTQLAKDYEKIFKSILN
jgi:glycosyltransferase involved in cell wall biosynthesis